MSQIYIPRAPLDEQVRAIAHQLKDPGDPAMVSANQLADLLLELVKPASADQGEDGVKQFDTVEDFIADLDSPATTEGEE